MGCHSLCKDRGKCDQTWADLKHVFTSILSKSHLVCTLESCPAHTLLHCYNAVSTGPLLAHCLDTFAAALQGLAPLHHAVLGGRADVAAALLSQGADVNAKDARVRHADT